MSDVLMTYSAVLAFGVAYLLMGLLVLIQLDELPRFRELTRRWSAAKEWWSLVLWPATVAWLAWRSRRHG